MRPRVTVRSLKLDHYDLGAKLVNDELQVSCSYGGGCESHELDLVAMRYVFDAGTAAVDLIITHNANNDACEAVIGSDHRFDLTPIKAAYAESAAATVNLPITLQIFDYKGDKPNRTLAYKVTK
jgi:hypothetical protein